MQDEIKTDLTTLTYHILKQQQQIPSATGDLSILVSAIATACKWISNVVRKADLLSVIGAAGAMNVQNEVVQKLDLLSNEIMINLLTSCGKACLLISEENEEPIFIKNSFGKYCVVFDPLDGSSNIDCGVSIGTIFGIYKIKGKEATIKDVLCSGNEMVGSGYCMYGSSTMFVFTTGKEVNGYILDPNIGEFILSHPKIRLGSKKIYSINEGYAHTLETPVVQFLNSIKYPNPESKDVFKPWSHRYIGSMVADMHRTLLYGGLFMYPQGKLRLLYECFPMAMLIEAAGGMATEGKKRILELVPEKIHSRSPIFLGNKEYVETIKNLYLECDK